MSSSRGYAVAKRILDAGLALIGLLLSAPVWCLIALAVLVCDGRPVLFVQQRVGRGGKLFRVLKFRTMGYRNQNSFLPKLLRRTALDELPQLLNIARGEMSFVGPRPLIEAEVAGDPKLLRRTEVKPGLTGVAQVAATKDTPVDEKLEYDLWYIRHCSFWLDVRLILTSCWYSLGRKWDALGRKTY